MFEKYIETLADAADKAEAEGRFASEALALLRESGALTIGVPEFYGGPGMDLKQQLETIYIAGRASASLGTILGMHLQQVAALARYGNDALKDEVFPRLAEGAVYLGSVTTEAGRGGDLRASNYPLVPVRAGLKVTRDAPIVTGAQEADAFLVKMADPANGNSLVYVPRDMAEIKVSESSWDSLGMRESASMAMKIDAVIPKHYLIGEPGGFEMVVRDLFGPFAHLSWAASWLGAATEAGNRLVTEIRNTPRIRKKVMESELSLQRLARARECLDTVHALLEISCGDFERPGQQGRSSSIRINELKTSAANLCFEAVNLMVEIGGLGHGYMRTSPTRLERVFRDLRSASMNYSNDRLYNDNGRLVLRDGFQSLAARD
ncbi:acyl-CoA dehydrogenase family protein [Kocuria marina]|uniref:acyl-CoA dehydrogenase family protein n=1 Tax=Kocuria marina TaxID=223184 RepID=UPI001643CA2B|nr:acyl-CoA dehydrogenase family protein [Kocuria indica]